MIALPSAGDLLLVIRESQDIPDTELLPWEILQTAFLRAATSVPASTAAAGSLHQLQTDSEFIYVRNSTQWQRIPYDASDWSTSYVTLLRPVFPSLTADPVGAPNGHGYYNATLERMRFKQGDSYVSLEPPQSFSQVTDGTTTATAGDPGILRFRSSDSTVTVTVTANDPVYGDVVDLVVDPSEIATGDLNDDGTFALIGHNHDTDYAAISHDHDGVYSPVAHNHDTVYAALAHTHTGVYAPISHAHAASDTTSGTFADARIAQSNVTQHQAAINHDALTGFVGNEHIDHSSVSILTASGSGLTGGGDLTANRSLAFDFMGVTATSVVDLASDYLIMYDTSLGAHRRILLSTLGFDTADHTHIAAHIVSGVFAAERGGLGANAASFNGIIKMAGGVASVALAGTDYLADANHNHTTSQLTDFASAVAANTTVAANTAARHTQNTDTGTTAASFQIYSGSSGGRWKWDTTSSEMRLRNSADDAYATLRVGGIYAEGGITHLISNELEIGDNNILLNQDITAGVQNSDGGISIKLLDTADDTTRRDAKLTYNYSLKRWQGVGFRPVTEGPLTKSIAFKHVQLIGDGVSQNYEVEHGLNTQDLMVMVFNASTKEKVDVTWSYVDDDNIQVSFGADNIPTTNARKVVVIG